MEKTDYVACGTRPEEIVECIALDSGDYPQMYAEKIKRITEGVKDDELRKKVIQTLGAFESGSDEKLAQSSPYRLIVLQEILPKEKVLVARPRLQVAKEDKHDFIRGFYVDCGLNLVQKQDEGEYKINKILAEALANDLRDVEIDIKNAKLIPYNILTCQVDNNSESGLFFKLSEKGRDTARNLVLNTSDFKWNYLPFRNGLFRACLDGGGDWDADVEDLACSGGGGRVVVETTSEAGLRTFMDLKVQVEALFEKQRQERKSLAERLLKL